MASRPPCLKRQPHLPRGAALTALIALTFTLGCATSRDVPPAYLFYGKPPTPEMRAALGRTAIVVATNGVVVQADRPKSFGEATRHGFWWGLTDPAQQVRDNPHSDPGPGFIFAFPVWIVGQATVGTLAGTVMGVPAATSAKQQGVLRKVVDDLRPSVLLAQSMVESLPPSAQANTVSVGPETVPKDVDSQLRIALTEVLLIADQDTFNPPLRLALAIRVQWVRAADGTVVYENEFTYRGVRLRKLATWSQDNGRCLRVELQRLCVWVGGRMRHVLWEEKESLGNGFYSEVPN